METTNGQDYSRKSMEIARVTVAAETKNDLRKAHFTFGNDNNGAETFQTTNMDRFKKLA